MAKVVMFLTPRNVHTCILPGRQKHFNLHPLMIGYPMSVSEGIPWNCQSGCLSRGLYFEICLLRSPVMGLSTLNSKDSHLKIIPIYYAPTVLSGWALSTISGVETAWNGQGCHVSDTTECIYIHFAWSPEAFQPSSADDWIPNERKRG